MSVASVAQHLKSRVEPTLLRLNSLRSLSLAAPPASGRGNRKQAVSFPPVPVALAMKALSYSGVSGVKFRPALLIVNPLYCRRFFAGRGNLP